MGIPCIKSARFVPLIAILAISSAHLQPIAPVTTDAIKDSVVFAIPSYSASGILGGRMQTNMEYIRSIQTDFWLTSFQQRNQNSEYLAEQAAKWLESASYAWFYSQDAVLKQKLDAFVAGLIAAQEPNGYLGNYEPAAQWTEWDVWNQKYVIIGLLSYYQFTGNTAALQTASEMGDLLCATFGPGKRNIFTKPLQGLASTSITVALTDLYRFTGNQAYLDFCGYVAHVLDSAGFSPEWFSAGSLKGWKAYEVFSSILGLLDYGCIIGDRTFIDGAENAWTAIYNNALYPIGTFSSHEQVPDDYSLEWQLFEGAWWPVDVGESCVTFQWTMLNWHLFRITGNIRYAQEMERTLYNAVIGGQDPRNGYVSYFTYLWGVKQFYDTWRSPSEPRVIARIPVYGAGILNGQPIVNLYTPGTWQISAASHNGPVDVSLGIATSYPVDGRATVTVDPASSAQFTLKLRVPWWCSSYAAVIDGQEYAGVSGQFLDISRTWQPGDRIEITMDMPLRLEKYGYPATYPGKIIFTRGPQVLAISQDVVNGALPAQWAGTQIYAVTGERDGAPVELQLVPYADAGQNGDSIFVVLDSMAADGATSRAPEARKAAAQLMPTTMAKNCCAYFDMRGRKLGDKQVSEKSFSRILIQKHLQAPLGARMRVCVK